MAKKPFAINLNAVRKKHDDTWKQLAWGLEMHPKTIISYGGGDSEPNLETLCKIAVHYKIDDLLAFISDPNYITMGKRKRLSPTTRKQSINGIIKSLQTALLRLEGLVNTHGDNIERI